MKKVLALLLVLAMAFGMVACAGETPVDGPQDQTGTAEPEVAKLDAQAMAEKFADGIFTPDMQSVFDLMPFDLAVEKLEGDEKEALKDANDALIAELQNSLDVIFADVETSWTIEVLSEEAVGEEELATLNEKYADYDLTVDEATAAAAHMSATVSGVEIAADVRLVFVLIENNWYMDIDSLSVIDELPLPEEEEDGFNAELMVGSFLAYMLTPDFASLMGMMPPALQEDMIAEMGEDYDVMVGYINGTLSDLYSLFDGVEANYSYEIVAETELDETQVAELAAAYLPTEVEFESAVSVDFTYTVSTMDEELPVEMNLIFVEQDGQWYLDGNSLINLFMF